MTLAADVAAPLIVAALVSWNDIVALIDTARGQVLFSFVSSSFTAWITATVSFQLTSAATTTGALTSVSTETATPTS